MNALPRWSLDTIYPSIDSREFSDDIAKVRKLAAAIEKDPCIESYDELTAVMVNLDAYVSALLSTDSENESYLKALSAVEDAAVIYKKAEDSFTRFVGQAEAADDDPLLIRELRIEAGHLMSESEEALAAELARSGENAWSRLQETLSSSIMDGKRTLTELRSLAFSPDRAVRKNAFEQEISLLDSHRFSFASALNGVKGTTITLERRRGWESPMARSLFSSRITPRTLDALLSAIRNALPLFRDYLSIKAGILGIDDFSFFDLFAPLGRSGCYDFDEAKDIVLTSYDAFSCDMSDFARHAFDSSWIDAEPHPGKAGGAYDVYFPLSHESRVFCNFDSSHDSVLTLAHELGHAYHDSVLKDLPQSQAAYPMTLAETASIFGELLVTDSLLSGARTRDEELFITEQFMSSACQTIVDIYSRYLFESRYFDRCREGEVSAAECSEIMLQAEKDAYGDSLKVLHPYMWAVKSHYYDASFSFYNYPYAFGLLLALSLYSMRNEPGFDKTYRSFLSRTGSEDVATLLRSIGMDGEDEGFWMKGVDMIRSFKERMEGCV